jgi:hypothetical protein
MKSCPALITKFSATALPRRQFLEHLADARFSPDDVITVLAALVRLLSKWRARSYYSGTIANPKHINFSTVHVPACVPGTLFDSSPVSVDIQLLQLRVAQFSWTSRPGLAVKSARYVSTLLS